MGALYLLLKRDAEKRPFILFAISHSLVSLLSSRRASGIYLMLWLSNLCTVYASLIQVISAMT